MVYLSISIFVMKTSILTQVFIKDKIKIALKQFKNRVGKIKNYNVTLFPYVLDITWFLCCVHDIKLRNNATS
jgi:hypothetical protein